MREDGPARAVDGSRLARNGYARNQVHQATGTLMAQCGVNAETAFARLRGHSFATVTGIELVADDVVGRRVRWNPNAVSRRSRGFRRWPGA